MGQIIDMRYGKASYDGVSATFTVFKVTGPFTRTSGANTGKKHGYQQQEPVGRFGHHGAVYPARVEHENGTIISVQTSWLRNRVGYGDAAIFVRLRADGAHWRIGAKLPQHRDNVYGEEFDALKFYGDILTLDELSFLEIEVPRGYRSRYMVPEEIAEFYSLTQLAPERAPPPTLSIVHTAEGPKKVQVASAPRRRLFRK